MSSLDAVKRGAALVVLTAGLAALVVGCGGSSSSSDPASTSTATSSAAANYSGAAANPPKPAPPLKLNNYNGTPVNLDQYRGKAVLVPSSTTTVRTSAR